MLANVGRNAKGEMRRRSQQGAPTPGDHEGAPPFHTPITALWSQPTGRPRGSPLLWTALTSRFVGIVGATLVVARGGGRAWRQSSSYIMHQQSPRVAEGSINPSY